MSKSANRSSKEGYVMAGLTRTLPKYVRIIEEEQRAREQVTNILSKTNNALVELQQMVNDLGNIPQDLAAINADWLNNIISAKIAAVEAMPLPQDTINSMIVDWHKVEKKAARLIVDIHSYKSVVPHFKLELIGGKVVCPNADKWIAHQATYTIPQVYIEHYRLLCNLVEASNKLRYYEQKNSMPNKSLLWLLSAIKSPDDYARMVADGVFSSHLTQEQFTRLYKYELMRQ